MGLSADALDKPLLEQHGLFWPTLSLGAMDPLLIVLDDAHWADRASMR